MDELIEGRYRVLRQLEGGGMSAVFLARDETLGRSVVIKVLSKELASQGGVERFRQEIALVATLSHPQIVPLLATGELDGLPFFVMPYVEGESLRQRLTRGPLSIREAVSILVDVARALAFAHERGVVHRDIKPDNILLTAHSAVVSDFGIAKARARGPLTSEGMSLGTPTYMAPEQIAGDETDGRTDLYALGAVGYEMLVGAPPFAGSTVRKLMTAHLTELPQPIARRRSDVPAGVERILLQCLAKEPKDRPRSASDVVRALQDPEVLSAPRTAVTASDIRGGLRGLVRSPSVTVYALICLALGTGAMTAVYSAIDRALIEPLPFTHAHELVTVYRKALHFDASPISPPNFLDLGRSVHELRELAAVDLTSGLVVLPDAAERLNLMRASGNAFPALGVSASHGRLLDSADAATDAPVVVLSHELWQSRFGGDTTLIGRSLVLDGRSRTVVGVLPPEFRLPHGDRLLEADVWIPLVFTPSELKSRGWAFLCAFGRLAPGATVRDADRELADRFADIAKIYPDWREESIRAVAMQADDVAHVKGPLLLLFGAVSLVLLVATSNVICLLLARGVHRQQEYAIRVALGASRWDVVRPVLVESVALAVAGVALGVGLAWISIQATGVHLSEDLPQLSNVFVGVRAIPFALGLSLLVAVVAGALPAWRSTRVDPHDAMRGGRSGVASRSTRRAFATLVVAEVALSLVLVIAAGLVLKGFTGLLQRDPGFDPTHVLTVETAISPTAYGKGTSVQRFLDPAIDGITRVPGVVAVGAISELPFRRWGINGGVRYEGRPNDVPTRLPTVEFREITPGFFSVTQQHLLGGRLLRDADMQEGETQVVVVNETLAKRDFPGEDPVGKRWYTTDTTFATIVGVVSSIRNMGPIMEPRAEMYTPYQSAPVYNIMVRVREDPRSVRRAVAAAIHAIDPQAAVTRVMPMPDVIRESVRRQRFFLVAIGLFAGIAMVLAGAGLHGVLSYVVAQRTRELGIRTALGSTPARTIGLVVSGGFRLIATGVVLGLVGSALVTRVLSANLYGLSPRDWTTWLLATLVLVAIGLLATLLPSLRAAAVDPMSAMRAE
jgi:putative ABC transport system permease protein